jgi:acyl-CoA reductase-like NAD-dependent aldehyde dehydrogenase
MHQFVVSNHMLTAHIATLSYYVRPQMTNYDDPAYAPVIDAILRKLEKSVTILVGPAETATPAVSREELRKLNEKMNALLDRRKTELAQGIIESDTRKTLSELKPVIDQFNFIAKVSADIEKLSYELSSPNLTSHGAS